MPAVTQIIEKRESLRTAARRSPARKLALSCSGLLSLAIALFCLFLALEYTALTRNLPPIETLPLLVAPPGGLYLQPTRFYDRSGEHLILELQNPAVKGAQYLYFPDPAATSAAQDARAYLPANVISATIAASDPGFWSHPGFSLTGIPQNTHTTIAQRLVSTLLLQDEPDGLRRALRERLLAAQLTERYGRRKVIEWYLNTVDYGYLAYGVDAASHLYFGRPASELDLAQAAALAAIADDPTLDPNDAPELLIQRQRRILWDMLRLRMIHPQEGIDASREVPVFVKNAFQGKTLAISDLEPQVATAFVHLAFEQLTARIPRSRLERGGLRILTTLDYDLQQQLACASLSQVQRLEPTQSGASASPAVDCPAARLLPSMPGKIELAPANLAADGIILDPQTGEILALVGQLPGETGNGYLTAHPAGSLSTLFIYMTAFTRGLSPASLLWDIPPIDNTSMVQNFDQQYHGPLRLRIALVNDYLVPAEQVLTQVGIENVWRTARQLGLAYPETPPATNQPALPSALSLFRPLDLVEVSHALSVFANQGVLAGRASEIQANQTADQTPINPALPPMRPNTVLRADDLNGKVYLDWSATQSRPILTPELAYIMTNVLSDETARWPSLGHPNPLEVGRPAAAKLSSTFDGESNWAIGYTPQRFVGVWLGQPTHTDTLSADTAHSLRYAAAGLWHAIMQYSSRYLPFQTFNVPSGLSIIQVCDPSGLLPTAACPNVVDEVFLPGNEPVQIDTLYRLVSINRESGRLATIFSPPDLVEPRAYISVPPEATQWAERAGLETPPDTYDILPVKLPAWKDTQISTPAMFARVRGQVTISGTASGDNLAFYRIQVGQGPDPTLWYQVGEDAQLPIVDGKLATWDTSHLDGLYAVQLLLVRKDQSAERSTVLVTVDNQPPQVKILNPLPDETVQKSARPSIVFLAEIDDNLGIDNVAFMVDGRLVARLIQPPFAISWTTTTGNHTLRIVATDEAGNTSEAQSTFSVK
jgi:membrane peptidoglycan carboxypeptidase